MMHGPMLPLSAVLLVLLAAARGQEVCSDAESVITTFDDVNAGLNCDERPTYRWWRSNDGCRSFVEHTICNAAQSCFPAVNASLERYYHFCCTDDSVVAGSDVATSSPTCFHIQICTAISNEVTPPIVLLGATEKLYVLLFGEPTPTDSPELKLVNATNAVLIKRLSAPQIDFTYLNDTTSEQAFIYTFNVPDDIDDGLSVSDVRLEFSTQYSTPSDSCSGLRDTTIDIPVRRTRTTATPAPTSTACPPPPTAMPCRNITNLAAGFIASSVILLLLLLLLAVILVVVCWRLKRHQRKNSDSTRPPDLPIITGRQYRILRQTSVTPGTPGTTFANTGQQPPLPPLPITTAETAFAETPQTLMSRDSTATSDTDEVANAHMSDSQSTDTERMGPNAVDCTDSSHLATDSALETESTVIRHHGVVYDGLNRELPNPGLSIDV